MAINLCARSTHSPAIPTVSLSSLSTKSSLKTLQFPLPLSAPSSAKFSLDLDVVSNDALTIAAAAEAAALASAAAEAAREAVCSASKLDEISFCGEKGDSESTVWSNASGVRRKRRRKRRKESELEDIGNGENQIFKFAGENLRYLTSSEEAQLSSCIKVSPKMALLKFLNCYVVRTWFIPILY